MRTSTSTTICLISFLLLLGLTLPAAAADPPVPTDWEFSWTLDGDLLVRGTFVPTHIEGTSRAELVPRPELFTTFPHDRSGPVYSLTFEHNSQQFGGLVSDSAGWGPTGWEFPEFGRTSVVGVFGVDEKAGRFSIAVGTLSPHGPFLSGTGTTVSAAEPHIVLLVAGALGLVVRWRRRE
jgi:hypothetical protein